MLKVKQITSTIKIIGFTTAFNLWVLHAFYCTNCTCLDHAAAPGFLEEYLFEISFGMYGLLASVNAETMLLIDLGSMRNE